MLSERSDHTYSVEEIEALPESDIFRLAQSGNETSIAILMQRYKYLARTKTANFYIAGADREDTLQEGMIGLFKAILDYDIDSSVSFPSFAGICIYRYVGSAVRKATSQKSSVLNTSISLDKPVFDQDGDRTLQEFLPSSAGDPVDLIIAKEQESLLFRNLDSILTEFERTVLQCFIDGLTYHEIAVKIDKSEKSIDNALQRVRRKISAMRSTTTE